MTNPLDRLTSRVPEPWRGVLDWTLSIVLAVVVVLAVKVEVANPYRVPSASMEPTLHCARPADSCLAGHSDRVVANRFIYRFRDPERGEIVVFDAPAKTQQACNESGTFVKRIVGLPGEVVSERNGVVYIDGHRLDEPYVVPSLRDKVTQRVASHPAGPLLHDGRQPDPFVRLARMGNRASRQPHRPGVPHLLAPRPGRDSVGHQPANRQRIVVGSSTPSSPASAGVRSNWLSGPTFPRSITSVRTSRPR